MADQVSEADILELFRNRPAEASSRAVEDYRQAKEAADRQRVLDYAMMDAAASLASTVESAQSSFDDLTANGNLSATALQQAQVAAALTQGRINAAVAQVLAYQAVEQANRMQQAEIRPARAARRVEGRTPPYERDGRCDAHGPGPESRPAPGGAPLQDPVVLHGRPSIGPGSDCHATPATAVDRSERPGPDPRGSTPGLQGVPGRRARHRGRRRGARRADARPPALGRSRGRSSSHGAASRSRSAEPSSPGPSCGSCSGSRFRGRCSITTASRSRAWASRFRPWSRPEGSGSRTCSSPTSCPSATRR